MGGGAEGGVVMESAPRSTFVVVESDFLLKFLVIALDAPAEFGGSDERNQRGVLGERSQPEPGRLGLPIRPFDEQPHGVGRGASAPPPMVLGGRYSDCSEAGRLITG